MASDTASNMLSSIYFARSLSEYGILFKTAIDFFPYVLPIMWTMVVLCKVVLNHASWILYCSITVEENDRAYDYVRHWFSIQTTTNKWRSLQAFVRNLDTEESQDAYNGPNTKTGMFNVKYLISQTQFMYRPYTGTFWFWHHRRFFWFERILPTNMNKGRELITMSTFGGSVDPIKDLLEEAQRTYTNEQTSNVIIHRPALKVDRVQNSRSWNVVASRRSRDLKTILLEDELKQQILTDMNQFLNPQTHRWYEQCGIPYRRGYIFCGPPGTGKSSLSFALGAVFGLSIYCLFLSDPTLSDEELAGLFDHLPSRCIVLLEDIDASGIIDKASRASQIPQGLKGANIQADSMQIPSVPVSLSGLLNVLDGPASAEGRILIISTNKPEVLENAAEALIRPGRVDLKVTFSMATKSQIRQLVIQIWGQAPYCELNALSSELEEAAEKTANQVPEQQLSLADMQGFLLKHVNNPRQALEILPFWLEETHRRLGNDLN